MRRNILKVRAIHRVVYGLGLCAIGVYCVKLTVTDIHDVLVPFRDNYALMLLLAALFFVGGIIVVAFPKQARSVSRLGQGRWDDVAPGSVALFMAGLLTLLAMVVLMIAAYRQA